MLLILNESQNKYNSHTNTTILSRRLCVCFVCYLCIFLSSFFENATTTKTVNVDEWFKLFGSLISIINIFRNLWIWMSMSMNQTYFECYEFDVNVVLILNATCTYKSIGQFTRFCIVYVVLNTLCFLWTLNSIMYSVFRIPNVFFFFWHSNNLIVRNQRKFWKTYENIYFFFHLDNLIARNQHNFWKKVWKKCVRYTHSNFTWKLSTASIHCYIIVQQYIQNNTDTIACVNCPNVELSTNETE